MMEETREGGEEGVEEEVGSAAASLPPQMQLLSTWEVRRVPHNCVTRLCTVTVTRLEVKQALEPNLPSVVVAVAMKTPHRFLRSNEISLPLSGTLDIPLQLTFALQYPHFLKRGGNILQIRVQRRKRYRNRAIGGYKTLAMGTLEMSQVLQTSYSGEVHLVSEKPPQVVAVVTVGSLTSTPVYLDSQREGSSDEEEDDIAYSDYHGSDSDSGEGTEVYRSSHSHKLKSKAAKPSSRMLRLLGIKSSKTHTAEDELMDLQGEDPECAVTFASSVSDSEEDEEGVGGPSTPPRPTLSPFFGSDRCSMVSIPNSVRSAEVGSEFMQQPPVLSVLKQSSVEDAPPEGEDPVECGGGDGGREVGRKRVWVVGEEGVAVVLREVGEKVLLVEKGKGREEVVSKLQSQLTSLTGAEVAVLAVAVIGEEVLVSAVLQAILLVTAASETPTPLLRLLVIPTSSGVVSSRVWLLDDSLSSSFPLDTDWSHLSSSSLLRYADSAVHAHSLPVAQVVLHRVSSSHEASPAAADPTPLPFMFSVSVGSLDAESEQLQPHSPPSASSVSEATELVVEYWTGKKDKEKTSLKVRCVIAACDSQGLNVTTLSRDRKGKGIRIRKKEKEGESGSSIISLSTSQLLCRPANKQDSLSVVVDGVEWSDVNSLKITHNTGHFVTIATTNPAPPTEISH